MRAAAKLSSWFAFVCSVVGLDVATRVLCFERCTDNGGWVGLAPFANVHFAFSLQVPAVLMYAVYVIALSALVWLGRAKWRVWSELSRLAFVLVLCGGGVNVLERLWLGYVRDFIRVFHGYYNLGDIYILVGIALLLLTARNAEMR